MFNRRIDKFVEYDNKISDLQTKKTEYLKMIEGLDKQISNTVDKKLDFQYQLNHVVTVDKDVMIKELNRYSKLRMKAIKN